MCLVESLWDSIDRSLESDRSFGKLPYISMRNGQALYWTIIATRAIGGMNQPSAPVDSEVVRAGIRMLMERDGARQFYALKAVLEQALRDAE